MTKSFFWLAVFIAVMVELYGLLPYRRSTPVPLPEGHPQFVSGAIHFHSIFSDGGGGVSEIVSDAKGAGLDFVVLTDHNVSTARKLGLEKNYEGVDFFVEMEGSTPGGHLIPFYSQTSARQLNDVMALDLAWRHFLGEKTVPGLFVAIAHPSNIKNPWIRLDRFTDGIEVVNFDSMWQRQVFESIPSFALTAMLAPFNEYLASLRFYQVYKKDLSAWDALLAANPKGFGILAHDTHSKLKYQGQKFWRWPGYLLAFKLGSNVVFVDKPLPEDFEARKKTIYESIRQGKSAFLFQSIAPYAGNDWKLRCGGQIVRSGGTYSGDTQGCQFEVATPSEFPFPRIIRLVRNGELAQEVKQDGAAVTLPVSGPGSYRLEVWAKAHTPFHILLHHDVPYLFYNAITVR